MQEADLEAHGVALDTRATAAEAPIGAEELLRIHEVERVAKELTGEPLPRGNASEVGQGRQPEEGREREPERRGRGCAREARMVAGSRPGEAAPGDHDRHGDQRGEVVREGERRDRESPGRKAQPAGPAHRPSDAPYRERNPHERQMLAQRVAHQHVDQVIGSEQIENRGDGRRRTRERVAGEQVDREAGREPAGEQGELERARQRRAGEQPELRKVVGKGRVEVEERGPVAVIPARRPARKPVARSNRSIERELAEGIQIDRVAVDEERPPERRAAGCGDERDHRERGQRPRRGSLRASHPKPMDGDRALAARAPAGEGESEHAEAHEREGLRLGDQDRVRVEDDAHQREVRVGGADAEDIPRVE